MICVAFTQRNLSMYLVSGFEGRRSRSFEVHQRQGLLPVRFWSRWTCGKVQVGILGLGVSICGEEDIKMNDEPMELVDLPTGRQHELRTADIQLILANSVQGQFEEGCRIGWNSICLHGPNDNVIICPLLHAGHIEAIYGIPETDLIRNVIVVSKE